MVAEHEVRILCSNGIRISDIELEISFREEMRNAPDMIEFSGISKIKEAFSEKENLLAKYSDSQLQEILKCWITIEGERLPKFDNEFFGEMEREE